MIVLDTHNLAIDSVVVSIFSTWEIAMLVAKGKLQFAIDLMESASLPTIMVGFAPLNPPYIYFEKVDPYGGIDENRYLPRPIRSCL